MSYTPEPGERPAVVIEPIPFEPTETERKELQEFAERVRGIVYRDVQAGEFNLDLVRWSCR